MFKVEPTKVAAPEVPVVVKVIAFCFPLNVLQSVEDKAPLLEAEAVGTFKVITGVVVPVATVLVKSVPLVPKVKAATEVTVPTLIEPPRLVLVPLIVIAEFVKLALPILLKVFVSPAIDLLVKVSVVFVPTKVVVAFGKVITLPAEETASIKVTALAALPELLNLIPLVVSVPSEICTKPEPFGSR